MLKLFFSILTLWCLLHSQIYAGLIDSLAAINNKNDSIAESLPKKKNGTSKYDCLKNKNKKPLETVLDAHNPVKFKLKAAPEQKMDVNKLSEKQLEAIGDAAIAEKLAENTKTTKRPKYAHKKTSKHATTKKFDFENCDDNLP